MDNFRAFKLCLLAAWIHSMRSPLNLLLFASVNVSYYVVQTIFWWGFLRSTSNVFGGRETIVFLVTLACVDNFYLLLFGKSSVLLLANVSKRRMESHILLPRHPLLLYMSTSIGFEHLPLTVVSLLILAALHVSIGSASLFALHLSMIGVGTLVLAGISLLFRMSIFWTEAIVNVKHANPSFKVMVRPLDAFDGGVRILFTFFLPCLLITGVPAALVNGTVSMNWMVWEVVGAMYVWALVFAMYSLGVRNYLVSAGS